MAAAFHVPGQLTVAWSVAAPLIASMAIAVGAVLNRAVHWRPAVLCLPSMARVSFEWLEEHEAAAGKHRDDL